MNDDIRKLLGGYATGTLTPEEHDLLFRAALADQDLFDTLAAEQPLRELLEDARARAELLAALTPGQQTIPKRNALAGWIFSGAVAACALLIFWIGLRPARPEAHAKVFIPPAPKLPLPVYPSPMEIPPSLPPIRALAPRLPLPPLQPAQTSRRLRVAVLDFESGEAGHSVSNYLNDKLVSDRVYTVIDRARVQQAVSHTGDRSPANPAQAARIGRQLGADAVVLGRVAGNGFADSSLIESATGRTLRDVKTVASPVDLKGAAAAIGVALERGASVTSVNGEILTLGIGSAGGVRPGDRFTISRDGSPIGILTITTVGNRVAAGQYAGAPAKIGDRAIPAPASLR